MKIQLYFSLKCAFFMLFSFQLSAQSVQKLTLSEALQRGVEASPQLKATLAKLAATESKTEQYRNAFIPNVALNSSYSRLSDNITPFSVRFPGATEATTLNPQILNQFNNRLSLQETVFTGFRAKNFYESALFLEKAAALDADKDRLEIKGNIVGAYINLIKLKNSLDILSKNSDVLRGRLNDVQNLVKSGLALQNDALKAEIAIAQLEMTQKELNNTLALAMFNLNLLLGLPLDTQLELDGNSVANAQSVGTLDAYLLAANTRPDIAAVALREQAVAKGIEVAKGAYLPTVSVFGNYYLSNPNQRVFPQQAQFKGTWDLGIQLSYNLTALYTTKAQIHEAESNLVATQAQKQQLGDMIKLDITNSFYNYRTAAEKVILAEKIIPQTIENQRVVSNKYTAQVATITEVLEADFLVIQSKLNLENAQSDVKAAYYKLMKAIGKL